MAENKAESRKEKAQRAVEKTAQQPKTGPDQDATQPEEQPSFLKDLMAISGYGGLFRFVSQARNGVIVESLETGKRMNAFATMKVSALEDIAIYTEEKEIPLEEILISLHKYENGSEAISPKSDPDELKDYFSAILPDYDRERVYVSDIKKVLTWYNLLLKYDLLKYDEQQSAEKADKKADEKADEKESGPAEPSSEKPADQ